MSDGSFIPKYQILKEFYRTRIMNQELATGQKIDSINKIMRRHGVSRETAKLVLKQLKSEGLIFSKQGKGSYVVPQPENNHMWGMIIPFYSSNLEQLIQFLEQEAESKEKKLTYFIAYNNPEEEMRLVRSMIFKGYEAVIVVPNYDETQTAEFYRKLLQGHTSVILIDNTMSGSYFRYVIQSYDLGLKRAVEYLMTVTNGNLLLLKSDTWKGRNLLGELIEQAVITFFSENFPYRSVFIETQIRSLNRGFLADHKIKSILTISDTDAIRILGRLKQWKVQVPEQVRIINYGNTELTLYNDPAISVIDCRYGEMAAKTAALIALGRAADPFEQHIILPELVIRQT